LAQLRMSTGDLEGAAGQLASAEAWLERLRGSADGARSDVVPDASPGDLVARTGVDLALAMDDAATALRWATHLSDAFWGPACHAKLLLVSGRCEEAAQALRHARPRCPRHEVVAGLLLAQAIAATDRNAATEAVGTALDLATRQGMLRTVASAGA